VSDGDAGEPKLLPLRIRLPFASEDEFVERYGANVEKSGLFIATRNTKPEGTAISFELVLQDGTRLMRGEGVVTQVVATEAPGQSGMRLRFTRLEARTKALVDRIMARPSAPPPTSAALPSNEPASPPAPSAPRPLPQVATDAVVGIDFGTSRCRAAVVIDAQVQAVAFGGANFLPAVVAVDAHGKLVVGARAEALAAAEPDRALFGLQRLLGRRARSQRVRDDARRFALEASPDAEGEVQIALGGQPVPTRAMAAALFGELKRAASQQLGAEVTRAVLGVPGWFTHRQRRALRLAAEDAGFSVLQLLNAPSAVGLAFGHGKGLARKRLLVYDFGGGTFDVAVVELTGEDLEVVSSGGDDALGGLDFDLAVAEALERTLPEGTRVPQRALRHSVERARVALSGSDQAPIVLPALGAREVTREWLEAAVAPLVDHSLALTRAVLESARLTPQGLDDVLATGGLSQMPLVRTRLEAALGRPVRPGAVDDGAVAAGCALFGHALSLRARGKAGSTVAEVLGAPIGVAVQGGGLRRVLERNTRLPATKTLPVPVAPGQGLRLAVFQGARPNAPENEFLGCLSTEGDRAGELLVRFSVSQDGLVEVHALASGGREVPAAWDPSEPADGTVEQAIAAAALPPEPRQEGPSKGIFGGFLRLFGRP
jgi:molecular chaperone DnaK